MKSPRLTGLVIVCFSVFLAVVPSAIAGDGKTVHLVTRQIPVQGPGHEIAVDLPAVIPISQPAASAVPSSAPVNNWQLMANLPGAVIKDISFPTAFVGYAVAE